MVDFMDKKYHKLFNISLAEMGRMNLPRLPDLKPISRACPKNGFFTAFNPQHMDAMRDVREILYGN
jgi:hypothetical protein